MYKFYLSKRRKNGLKTSEIDLEVWDTLMNVPNRNQQLPDKFIETLIGNDSPLLFLQTHELKN